ncbi:MAG: MarR family transcriptional regulator [Vulcanimicrobiota bacterium]
MQEIKGAKHQSGTHQTWVRVAWLYSKGFRRFAEKLAPVGLSVAQYDLLACLVAAEPQRLKQSDLASRLLVTKGNISGMLGRMTEQSMVKRSDDPTDRRSKRIVITEEGRALYERGRCAQEALIAELFGDITGERLRLFEEVVEQLCEKFKSEEEPN